MALYDYILLMRQRTSALASNIYTSYDSPSLGAAITNTIGSLDVLSTCNTIGMPSTYNGTSIRRITVAATTNNMSIVNTCCAPGTYNSSSETE